MNNPLVSIIVPCYNGEKTVARLLNSILNQTYSYLELIFVNDGSTDQTEHIVLSYQKRLEEHGIRFQYHYQKNQGLGGAINAGIKLFTGDYLCWPDADDYLSPDSVEKRVRFLEEHLEYGSVSSDAYIYKEKNLHKPIGYASQKNRRRHLPNQFALLIQKKSMFCPGCHMIRASAFLTVNPKREIYPSRAGQNWQMLLPVYYHYPHAFLDEPLYHYIIYNNSMSHSKRDKSQAIQQTDEFIEILNQTLDSIPMEQKEKNKYQELVDDCQAKWLLSVAVQYKDKAMAGKQYQRLKEKGKITILDKLQYCKVQNKFCYSFIRLMELIVMASTKLKRRIDICFR